MKGPGRMADTLRDPVCGMTVDPTTHRTTRFEERMFAFCSDYCHGMFLETPSRYARQPVPVEADRAPATRRIAYFSMEVGVDPRLPIYSGGLGVLAGDTLRSCADLKVPLVGVSLLYRGGYFEQSLDAQGNQVERPVVWNPSDVVEPIESTVHVAIEGRDVAIRAWRYDVIGVGGHVIPLILLDTDVEGNAPWARELTGVLYGGDDRYRLCQEIVLGIGGVRTLRALGYGGIERFHLNEGHASFLTLELLREQQAHGTLAAAIAGVRAQCVFTTHTPVAAGHDQFSYDLVERVLGEIVPFGQLRMLGGEDRLNMTLLALNLSAYVNGVAQRHGEVSQRMFPAFAIDAITNGVHSFRWTCDPLRRLYDRHIPDWRRDPFSLRHAIKIPGDEIWAAHLEAKRLLLGEVERRSGRGLSPDVLTIGFARRATAYKRPDLVFLDPRTMGDIARHRGPLQFVFAGKAHPKDEPGKELIRRIFRATEALRDEVTIVYLDNYDLELGRLLTAGADLWLNTPLRPLEASGTSGMKAAHNGVPSLSVLDGWWIEGHVEGVTGWSIGRGPSDEVLGAAEETRRDAAELYDKLGRLIIPLYYQDRSGWIDVMRRTIAINASFFNTHRMVQQYAASAYV